MDATGVEVWSSAPWREQAVSWLDDQLVGAGMERTGEAEQTQVRPWATVLKIPTAAGLVWFKAASPTTAFEVGLYELLHEVAPDHVLTPIAVDVSRAWMVLPDGGTPLGEQVSGPELGDAWERVLPQYGQLQRDLAPHADRLLDLGVADMRAAIMNERFEQALAAVGGYLERRDQPDERAAFREVAGMRETVEGWCERLACAPVPPSIDHNDMHPWNVFVGSDGQAKFYDWGDGVVSHPFASMLLPLGMVGVGEDDPQFARVRDSYLEAFSDLAPHRELVETLELACRVGKIARALTWDRAVMALDPDEIDDQWASAPYESLTSILDDSYVGRV